MFWTVEKLQARINELEPFRYRGERVIDTFELNLMPMASSEPILQKTASGITFE